MSEPGNRKTDGHGPSHHTGHHDRKGPRGGHREGAGHHSPHHGTGPHQAHAEGHVRAHPAGRPPHAKPKGAPPEATGAETNYIYKNMQARTPMVVKLVTNEELRGWIEYYDRHMIKLNRAQPPHLFIRKENIKYMYKDEGASQDQPRDKS